MLTRQTKYKVILLTVLALMLEPAFSQGFSHDGNRWYEIEISIFTNRNFSVLDKEQNLQENISLSYPDEILQLLPASASYAFDFSAMDSLYATGTLVEPPLNGPEYSPMENSFRVYDFGIDPFIALGVEHQKFSGNNQKISNSSEHRLLYHAVWRQPVRNKVQSTAIFIRGGEQFGDHNELEGSITLSYNINRVDIDALLWLNTFMTKLDYDDTSLSLPAQAFTLSAENNRFRPSADEYLIEDISLMKETRQMRSNELHYLDHPAFGLLVQIRPYDLPLNSDFEL